MSDDADDGDDRADPRLHAMRQVWLEMREQEPPGGGMAELLAAARAKAATMQPRPTWWQRMFAALRRPPVLAFATVVVLISGAVLVTRRIDSVLPAHSDEALGAAGEARVPAEAVLDREGEKVGAPVGEFDHLPAGTPASTAAATPDGDSVGTAAASAGSAAPVERQRVASPARPAGPSAPAPEPPAPVAANASEVGGARQPVTPREPEAAAPARARTARIEEGATRIAPREERTEKAATAPADRRSSTTRDEIAEPEPAAAPRPAVLGNTGPGAGQDEDAEDASRPHDANDDAPVRSPKQQARDRARAAALAPLYRQCEVAAQRGDCVAVRRLVAQIATQDPDYRSRLEKDSAVARCLP